MPMKSCPNCNADVWVDGTEAKVDCKKCQQTFFFADGEMITDPVMVAAEYERLQAEMATLLQSGDLNSLKDLPASAIELVSREIVLTTTFSVANREIDRELEIITAECVYGMNVLKDVFSTVRDVVGGRSRAVQDTLRDARKTVLTELRREALMIGAQAVVGIDLDYSEISGGGKSMLFLVASGTAVKLKD